MSPFREAPKVVVPDYQAFSDDHVDLRQIGKITFESRCLNPNNLLNPDGPTRLNEGIFDLLCHSHARGLVFVSPSTSEWVRRARSLWTLTSTDALIVTNGYLDLLAPWISGGPPVIGQSPCSIFFGRAVDAQLPVNRLSAERARIGKAIALVREWYATPSADDGLIHAYLRDIT